MRLGKVPGGEKRMVSLGDIKSLTGIENNYR